MLSQNTNALGIIFPNSYDNTVPELVTERAMASIPFAGRYRMVDFVLSSMANCGISNVSIVVRKNYHSLMDHLGTGREWDMARRHGGLNIVPPFAEKGVRIYSGRVEALGSILNFLENQKEKYVVMSDANIAINYDFNALLAAHQASGADVTIAYQKTEIPEGRKNDNYTLTVDADGRVTELLFNDYRPGVQNLDLNIYVLERETLIKLVKDATARGLIYFERDILAHNVNIRKQAESCHSGNATSAASLHAPLVKKKNPVHPQTLRVSKIIDAVRKALRFPPPCPAPPAAKRSAYCAVRRRCRRRSCWRCQSAPVWG